jgi:hypothetical protein
VPVSVIMTVMDVQTIHGTQLIILAAAARKGSLLVVVPACFIALQLIS